MPAPQQIKMFSSTTGSMWWLRTLRTLVVLVLLSHPSVSLAAESSPDRDERFKVEMLVGQDAVSLSRQFNQPKLGLEARHGDPVSSTLCLRYSRTDDKRFPICLATISLPLHNLSFSIVEDRNEESFSVRGFLVMKNDDVVKFVENRYDTVLVKQDLWASHGRSANNKLTCLELTYNSSAVQGSSFSWEKDFPLKFYSRTEQYGPLASLQPIQAGDVIEMVQYIDELTPLFKRISRTVNLPITFSVGCDLNDKFVQEIERANLRSFEGFIYDMNVYQGQFGVEQFIREMSCMSNDESLVKLASMTNFVETVRTNEKAGLAIFKQTSDEMMCHTKCIHTANRKKTLSRSRNCRANQSPVNVDAKNCEKNCRRIPKSVEDVDLCVNCMIYQFNCPIVKHLTKIISYNRDDPDFHAHKLFPWLLAHRENLLSVDGLQAVQKTGFGCRTHASCYRNKLSTVVSSCKRREGFYWNVRDERLFFLDENRCDIVLRTFSCLVDAIGDLAFSRDFPSCLIDSGRSTDMKCARGNYQLSALQAVTLQPNFTAQFCKTNYNLAVKIAPSCEEVRNIPVQWSADFLELWSNKPNYVPWTEITILGVVSTSPVSGETQSTVNFPTSQPMETSAVKEADVEKLLLRILTGCFITVSVIFLMVWFGLKCRRRDPEFTLIAHYINTEGEEQKGSLRNNPCYSGSNDYSSGLFINPSYATMPTDVGESSTSGLVPVEEYPINLTQSPLSILDRPTNLVGSQIVEGERTVSEPYLENSSSPTRVSFHRSRPTVSTPGPKNKHRISFYVNPKSVRVDNDFGYVEMKSLDECSASQDNGETSCTELETSLAPGCDSTAQLTAGSSGIESVSHGAVVNEIVRDVSEFGLNENEYEDLDMGDFTDVSSLQ